MSINVHECVGQYAGVSVDMTKEIDGVSYRVIVYGAYNARGLYGSENNGIAILNETKRNVLLDGELKIDSGWGGPSNEQRKRHGEIMDMTDEEFKKFVNEHPRARYRIGEKKKRATGDPLKALSKAMGTNMADKDKFHRAAKRALNHIAKNLLGLTKDQFEVRSNKGGPAVSGEVILHTDTLYVQVSKSLMGPGSEIMYRSCKGRKDYCGGQNHFIGVERLASNPDSVIHSLKTVGGLA